MTRAADLAKLIAGSSTLGGTGELVLKDVDTADGSSPKITFQTGDTDIAQDDVLGTIDFQAPDEGTGTDAILVSAGVEAKAEGDFSSSSNATSLTFKTGSSAAAAEKMRIDSSGNVGIGTASANHKLTVSGGTNTGLQILGNNTGTGQNDGFKIFVRDDNNGAELVQLENAFMTFHTNNTEHMRIDANGDITKPLQCYFHATPSSKINNITNGGSDNVVGFGTEIKDIGGNFASNTFTAPVTGTYFLYAQLRLDNLDTAADYYDMKIDTSNRNYRWIEHFNTDGGDYNYFCPQVTAIADMDANDTAFVAVLQNGGTSQVDVDNDSTRTIFMGYLLG
jgi:hypothetical protein